jgi:isopentenyl phosphate kinase
MLHGRAEGHPLVRMLAARNDVTGGIATKVAEAAAVAVTGIPVLIAQAGSLDAMSAMRDGLAVLEDPAWQGTVILAADPNQP